MGRFPEQRIQKALAAAGYGSRREIEGWIRSGRITVAGKPATLGQKINGRERVCLDGRPLRLPVTVAGRGRVLAYHKPVGETCTRRDPAGRPTVFAALPKPGRGRWVCVGRLDINTSGLLLFTTDGQLAHRLLHPSAQIEREYAVRVRGQPTAAQLRALLHGVDLDDGPARFTDVVESGGDAANRWYYVVLTEGRNREVRRLWESQGLVVSRLLRTRFGPCILPRNRRPGEHWELAEAQVTALYAALAP